MPNDYQLTAMQRRLSDALLGYADKTGQRLEEDIPIELRDCNDVPEFIRTIQKAHEETGKSTLRFSGLIRRLYANIGILLRQKSEEQEKELADFLRRSNKFERKSRERRIMVCYSLN